MSNQDKLFTEELARRNPDWKKIVDAHNDALAAEREALRWEKQEHAKAWEKVQDLLKHHARTSPVESQILLIEDLQRQLTVERERHAFDLSFAEGQLAAERKKVAELEQRLKSYERQGTFRQ